jgi:biotin operon repressor
MGIEKRLSDYDDISKYAETICSSGEKIKKKVDVSRKAIVRELETLKTEVGDLKIVMRSPN